MEVDKFEDVYKFLCDWTPQKDVLAIKYFGVYSGSSLVLTSSYVHSTFRRALKLKGQGFITSFLPTVAFPTVVGTMLHMYFVMKPILTGEVKCPVCYEIRSGTVALTAGVLYPCLLAPISSIMNANRYYTYAVPDLLTERKELFRFYLSLVRVTLPRLYLLSIAQFFGGVLWAHLEAKNFLDVIEKTTKMEAEMRERKLSQ